MNNPLESRSPEAARKALGYLNFSSGNREPGAFQALNTLFAELDDESRSDGSRGKKERHDTCTALKVIRRLEEELLLYSQESEAFRVDDQAGLVLRLLREELLPKYKEFHSELLFHQSDELIFNPFFLGKAFEAVLQQGNPWTESERIVPAASQ